MAHDQTKTEQTGDSVRSYFERSADSFDHLYNERGQSGLMRWVNRRFRSDIVGRYLWAIDHVRQTGAKSVLDVGCGSGRYLSAFARSGVERLVGVDVSGAMLELAARQLAGTDHRNFELIQSDFLRLATDERFDVIVAMGFFDYQADPTSVLSRMRELARHSVIASFPSKHWFRTPLRKFRYFLKRCPVYFYDKQQIESIAREAGFRDHVCRKLSGKGMDYVVIFRALPAHSDL